MKGLSMNMILPAFRKLDPWGGAQAPFPTESVSGSRENTGTGKTLISDSVRLPEETDTRTGTGDLPPLTEGAELDLTM
jgi:hypothetical protein